LIFASTVTELKKKPLVEVIVELRWRVPALSAGLELGSGDPHYQLLLGRFYDRMRPQYPSHEALPAAQMPDSLVGQIVQHRFRTAPNDWPLVQIGPGIMTVNETRKYTWLDFRQRSVDAVRGVFEAYPGASPFVPEKLTLRYIDALPFAPANQNVISFLKDKLQITIDVPAAVFTHSSVSSTPKAFQWQAAYPFDDQSNTLAIKIALGKKGDEPAILLDTSVDCTLAATLTGLPANFADWVDKAHEACSTWFKKLTEGELYDSFEPIQAKQ
jgi:uncharacterized protein (TIGR04255 family)